MSQCIYCRFTGGCRKWFCI